MSDDLPDDCIEYDDYKKIIDRAVECVDPSPSSLTEPTNAFEGRIFEDSSPWRCWRIDLDNDTQEQIVATYINHMMMLLEKNKRYGNSALEPAEVFYQGSSFQGLLVRIDDKLKRIKNSEVVRKNDVADLVGYLMLFMVQQQWFDFDEMID